MHDRLLSHLRLQGSELQGQILLPAWQLLGRQPVRVSSTPLASTTGIILIIPTAPLSRPPHRPSPPPRPLPPPVHPHALLELPAPAMMAACTRPTARTSTRDATSTSTAVILRVALASRRVSRTVLTSVRPRQAVWLLATRLVVRAT
jgi:hypothetical protein